MDAPGHFDFVRSASILCSIADAAVVVLSGAYIGSKNWQRGNGPAELRRGDPKEGVYPGGFEVAMRMVKGFGIKRVIVAVNKLDAADDPEKCFEEAKAAAHDVIKRWGVGSSKDYARATHREFPYSFRRRVWTLLLVLNRLKIRIPGDVKTLLGRALLSVEGGQVDFIPVSGWTGDMLTPNKRGGRSFSWYRGPTLLESLEALPSTFDPGLASKSELLFQVMDSWRVRGVGYVLRIYVRQGTVSSGQEITLHPTRDRRGVGWKTYAEITAKIYGVHSALGQAVAGATAGSICTISIKNLSCNTPEAFVNYRSMGAGDTGHLRTDTVHRPVKCFTALVYAVRPLNVRATLALCLHTARCTVRIIRIIWIGEKKEPAAATDKIIPAKQPAEVELEMHSVLGACMTTEAELLDMSRFVFRLHERFPVGIGRVKSIVSYLK